MIPNGHASLDDAARAARAAYEWLLWYGIETSDQALARNVAYRRFLMAGLELRHSGGATAVRNARTNILAAVPGADARHFERLWDGLMND